MKKEKVHRLAAFMTAFFLVAADLGQSGYVMVSQEAVAAEADNGGTVSGQEGQEQQENLTQEASVSEAPQITPEQGEEQPQPSGSEIKNDPEQEPAMNQEPAKEQEPAMNQEPAKEQESAKEQEPAKEQETATNQESAKEQEASQEPDQGQTKNQEQQAASGEDLSKNEKETDAQDQGKAAAPADESGNQQESQAQKFAYVETKEDHVPVYTAADGNSEKKGEILKKDSLLLREPYEEKQGSPEWVKVWFDTNTEEGKISGFVTLESLKKEPVEDQNALLRIQNSGLVVDSWQDPEKTRPLAEIEYLPVNEQSSENESVEEITKYEPSEEPSENDPVKETVKETGAGQDEKSAEGEEETNKQDIIFRIHWDESAMPEAGDKYRPDSVFASLYLEDTWKDSVTISKKDFKGQDSWEGVFKSKLVNDPTGNPYEYSIKVNPHPSTEVYKLSDIRQSEENPKVYEVDAVLQQTSTIRAEIEWNDHDDAAGVRPQTLTSEMITLKNGISGTEIYHPSSVEKKEDGNYTAIFENIPTLDMKLNKGYAYIVKVSLPKGYGTSSQESGMGKYRLLCTYNAISASVDVNIRASINANWDGGYDGNVWGFLKQQGVTILDSVIVTLTSHGQSVNVKNASQMVKCSTDSENDSRWLHWYLPVYDEDGQAIDYSDLEVTYQLYSEKGQVSKGFQVECVKKDSYRYNLWIQYAGFIRDKVKVSWEDEGDLYGLRPYNIEMQMLANGKPVEKSRQLTLRRGQDQGYLEGYFPAYDEKGMPIQYSVKINGLPDYYEIVSAQSPAFDSANGYPLDLTRTNNMEDTFTFRLKDGQTLSVETEWRTDGQGSEVEMENRPKQLSYDIEYTTDDPAAPEAVWKAFWGSAGFSLEPDQNGSWGTEITLPQTDPDGNKVYYRIKPEKLNLYKTVCEKPEYTVDAAGNINTICKIVNTYTDSWNYSIDLSWDTENHAEKYAREDITVESSSVELKYQLTIVANQDYDTEKLQVRLPYVLWKDRNKNSIVPGASQISVPQNPDKNAQYAFNYYVDDKGTKDQMDDQIVFVNREPIQSGFKQTLTVGYTVDPCAAIDWSRVQLVAKGEGISKSQEEASAEPSWEKQESNAISYRIDTGALMKDFSVRKSSKEKDGRLYSWNKNYGEKPEDFDITKYNYVVYDLRMDCYGNQPFRIDIEEKPGENGKVVGCCKFEHDNGWSSWGHGTIKLDKNTGKLVVQVSKNGNGRSPRPVFVHLVVAYPREEGAASLPEGQTTEEIVYHNTAIARCLASDEHEGDKTENDKNDVSALQSQTAVIWKDYKYNYNGDIYSTSKYLGDVDAGEATSLRYGCNVSVYTKLTMSVLGYDLDGYGMVVDDTAVYAKAAIGNRTTEYIRLKKGDYYFSGSVGYKIRCTNIDKTNGETLAGTVTKEPFILQGQTEVNGTWKDIGSFTIYSDNMGGRINIPNEDYVGLRIATPKSLQGKYELELTFQLIIKADSPSLKNWLQDEALSQINIENLAAYRLYDKDGNWLNPYSSSSNTLSKQLGLDKEDKIREGAYLHRKNYGRTLSVGEDSSRLTKSKKKVTNDALHSKVDVEFEMHASEVVNAHAPDSVLKEKSAETGVLYDLLPLGYVYNENEGVRVTSYTKENWDCVAQAALEQVETIDDYQGTGRQMVIFHVRSLQPEGENTSYYYYYIRGYATGFTVKYTASISWSELAYYDEGYNIVAYQRGDGKEMAGAYTERGYGSQSNPTIFPFSGSGSADEDRVLYDVNGDGSVGEKNTNYAYCKVSIPQYTTIQNGISKAVKGSSGYYQKQDAVRPDKDYSYKIRFTSSDGGKTRDLVLLDILENAWNVDGNQSEGWQGCFKGVQYRLPANQGIDVKILYSTAQGLNYNDTDKMNIDDSTYWSTTPPEDLSMVTAIAFDLRKKTDGTDFVMEEETSTQVEVLMHSPDKVQKAEYAYNRPSYWSTFQANGSKVPHTEMINGGCTALALRNLQDFSFVKQYQGEKEDTWEEIRRPLGGIQFQMYACTKTKEKDHVHYGQPGTKDTCWGDLIRTVSSNTDGEVRFSKLDTGDYAIRESSARGGFNLLNNRWWILHVDAFNGKVDPPLACTTDESKYPVVEMELDENIGKYTLLNARPLMEIQVCKTWKDENQNILRPAKITFDLYRNGKLYRTAEMESGTSSKNLFTNLYVYDEYGKSYQYEVRERRVPGYQSSGSQTVRANTGTHAVYFTNTRQGILEISKKVAGGDTKKRFTFHIQLKQADGTVYNPVDESGNPASFTVRRYAKDDQGKDPAYTDETVTMAQAGLLDVGVSDGERVRVLDLPEGICYKVTEETESYTSVLDGDCEGTIGNYRSSVINVSCQNTVQPVSYSIPVEKKIAGDLVPEGSEKEFTFTLEGKADETTKTLPPMPSDAQDGKCTVKITGEGKAGFGEIQYTSVGTYEYTVTEKSETEKFYTYDEHVYQVKVIVTDQQGLLKAALEVDGQSAAQVTVTNVYKPDPTPTPKPTATPTPKPTATPVVTPALTVTPEPCKTPAPEATVTPTPEPSVTPQASITPVITQVPDQSITPPPETEKTNSPKTGYGPAETGELQILLLFGALMLIVALSVKKKRR